MASDIPDWTITFVETGANANIGQRLRAVERHVGDEPLFLANYSDGLTDLSLPLHLEHFRQQDVVASFVSVRPHLSSHVVTVDDEGKVSAIQEFRRASIRINGGFFVLRNEIFDYLKEGEELVVEPFQRLVATRRLAAYEYDGFWMSMDTFKDRQQLEDIYARGHAPWEVWNNGVPAAHAYASVAV